MQKSTEGSTRQLIELCAGYFFFYVLTGISAKLFTENGNGAVSLGMNQIDYMVFNTIGGTLTALGIVIARRWYRLRSNRYIKLGSLAIPQEMYYIVPSGFMTAIIIPTTTLMYTFQGMSVMVAMVIMRASVIIISRVVDSVQIAQGILKKKVYIEENIAVVFALLAASVKVFWVKEGDFAFIENTAAVSILVSYIIAYSIRIYIMNYYKNTRAQGVPLDNQGFFGLEQFAACFFIVVISVVVYYGKPLFGWEGVQVTQFHDALGSFSENWGWAVLSGTAFGIVAFYSVFIFMFKGRTATFAGLVNRLTSLTAGTFATLLSAILLATHYPNLQDWLSLAFILIAVGFLTVAEKKRAAELIAKKEI